MGTWYLEVFRMTIYLSFPVVLFHVFNQPEYFEEWVLKTKRELLPPTNKKQEQEMKDFIEEMRKKENAVKFAGIE